ncbi:MAG: hypothetical protein JO016_11855 [Actinobacteria bacterium]|nr:hypothetical protein [Actinomycetota bacterium]
MVDHAAVAAPARPAGQQRGRIRPDADCEAAASMLLGSAFQYAFFRCFAQLAPDPEAAAAHATAIAATLLTGLAP